jgi:hypothetical protein
MSVDGRRCRTEPAKVNRTLYLSKMNGSHVDEADVRAMMAVHGELELVTFPSDVELATHRLKRGCFVKFIYFQDAKDAHSVSTSLDLL